MVISAQAEGGGGWLCRNILIISASKIENLPTVHDPRAVEPRGC